MTDAASLGLAPPSADSPASRLGLVAPAKPATPDAPRWDVLGDIGKAASESAGALEKDVGNAFSIEKDKEAREEGLGAEAAREAGKFGSALKIPLDVMGLVASPVTGAARAIGGSALSYLPGVTKRQADEGVDTAMMGLAPKSGLKAPPIGPRIPPGVNPKAAFAIDQGYVLPPAVVTDKPGFLNDLLSGEAGKVKLFQKASEKNQAVTDSLAAKSIGLPPDARITKPELERIRADAAKSYDDIRTNLPSVDLSDPLFQVAVKGLGGRMSAAAKAFPGLMKNPAIDSLVDAFKTGGVHSTEAIIETVRKLRHDASMNFRSVDDPEKAALAFAQKDAANALDATIERALIAQGKLHLAVKYRDGRMMIAKTHDIEDAMVKGTDHVSAARIAAIQNRGGFLSGDLKTIADTYNNFPRAMQNPSKFGATEDYSVLDLAAATASAAAGHLAPVAAIASRPAARNYLLTPRHQQSLLRPSNPPGTRLLPFTSSGEIQDAINPPVPTP